MVCDMVESIKQMFSAANGQVSSKRVMGVLIVLAIVFAYVYCAISEHDMPDGTGELLLAATTLLGVDSVTSVFKHAPGDENTNNN